MKIGAYWKGIIAALGVLVAGVLSVISDGEVTTEEWGVLLTFFLAFIGVVAKRNDPLPPKV